VESDRSAPTRSLTAEAGVDRVVELGVGLAGVEGVADPSGVAGDTDAVGVTGLAGIVAGLESGAGELEHDLVRGADPDAAEHADRFALAPALGGRVALRAQYESPQQQPL